MWFLRFFFNIFKKEEGLLIVLFPPFNQQLVYWCICGSHFLRVCSKQYHQCHSCINILCPVKSIRHQVLLSCGGFTFLMYVGNSISCHFPRNQCKAERFYSFITLLTSFVSLKYIFHKKNYLFVSNKNFLYPLYVL